MTNVLMEEEGAKHMDWLNATSNPCGCDTYPGVLRVPAEATRDRLRLL